MALNSLLNLQENLCYGVPGSWHPQHLPDSLDLSGIGLLGCGLVGILGMGGLAAGVVCGGLDSL
jgi:hypothetical protein